MKLTTANHNMDKCIEKCLYCFRTCLEQAMRHCLERGGKHVEPHHFRLMVNCAGICQTAAEFMLSGSDLHRKVCAACADVCEACAQSCKEVGRMEECVDACQECAESCRQMATAEPSAECAVLTQPPMASR
jgi:hypothetical protein